MHKLLQRIASRRFVAGFGLGALGFFLTTRCKSQALSQRTDAGQTAAEGKRNPALPDDALVNAERSIFNSDDSALKRQARADYEQSLEKFSKRLSDPIAKLADEYDIVVIGSGYGASVMGARLAAKLADGKSLCMVERGKEWLPGTFPDSSLEFNKEIRSKINPKGLYELSMHDEIIVLQGSGLGGTSLINANVAARANDSVFTHSRWPQKIKAAFLQPYYKLAESMLAPIVTTEKSSGKASVQQMFAQKNTVAKFQMAPLTIQPTSKSSARDPISNPHGMIQRPCTFCGDCMTGCNVGAKNSLPFNYLSVAKKNSAQIFTELEVDTIEKKNDHYLVNLRETQAHDWISRIFGGKKVKTYTLKARVVIVGAGALGSTGILMRSKKQGLTSSSGLGKGFSGNGDYFAILRGLDLDKSIHDYDIGGQGAYLPNNVTGPSLQTLNAFKNKPSTLENSFVFEDLSIPRAVIPAFRFLTGPMKKAFFLFGVGHDSADGQIVLNENGDPEVKWPTAKANAFIENTRKQAEKYASIFKAKISQALVWGEKQRLVTAHPLGGCCMSDDPTVGAVNHKGQLYANDNGSLHKGLYVVDASVIPTSLGINPFLTITALAEYIASELIAEETNKNLFR